MPAHSKVSIVYGVQVDACDLLIRCLAYPSFQRAETFFALLSDRARNLTLGFDAPLHTVTIASLPIQLRDMILEALWDVLSSDARITVIDTVCECACTGEEPEWADPGSTRDDSLSAAHVCGIDCGEWLDRCFAFPESVSEVFSWNVNRFWNFKSSSSLPTWSTEVRAALKLTGLCLPKDLRLDEGQPFRCIVGLPFVPSSVTSNLVAWDSPRDAVQLSEIFACDDSDHDPRKTTRAIALDLIQPTAEECRRFDRARRLLGRVRHDQTTPTKACQIETSAESATSTSGPRWFIVHEGFHDV